MKIEDTDKTQPERLSANATTEQRLMKFTKIVDQLETHGIKLLRLDGGCPVLEYNGNTLKHNIITWEVFKIDEVVSMILNWKNKL